MTDREESRATWQRQARQRAVRAGAETPEDRILRALLSAAPSALAEAARTRDAAALIDHDYLAYWVDEIGLQERWRTLG